jgi:hypothetical protein
MIYIPSFMKTGLGIRKLIQEYRDTQTTWSLHKPTSGNRAIPYMCIKTAAFFSCLFLLGRERKKEVKKKERSWEVVTDTTFGGRGSKKERKDLYFRF